MAWMSKFTELVHYVIGKQGNPRKLGATKLNKILWYADTFAYRATGETITGERYVKRQYGPVPKKILATVESLERRGRILVREAGVPGRAREFVSLSDADVTVFSEKELSIVDVVIEHICNEHTASSISEMSHDKIWDIAELGEEIPIFAVLAGRPGVVTKEDRKWADGIITGLAASKCAG